MSRFKHRTATVSDDVGNSLTFRALTPGERDQIKEVRKEAGRLPYFLMATCALDPTLSEVEARNDLPTDLLDQAVKQIMDWALPSEQEKKASLSTPSTSSAVDSPLPSESFPAK